MRRMLVAASLLVLASCSGSGTALSPSPSPTSEVVKTAPSHPLLTPSPSPSPSWLAPACRLPAMLWSDNGLESQGGFIDTTLGTFTPDPRSVTAILDAKALGTSYDAAQQRWLPVPREWVSPDGRSYAYDDIQPGPAQGVHIVDVSSGADHVVPGTSGSPDAKGEHYHVIAYQPDGIYLNQISMLGGIGLWLLDPATSAITQVSTDAPGYTRAVAGKQAWWTVYSADPNTSTDPHVYHQYLTGVAGQHGETWFERPGFGLDVIGADSSGHAILVAQGGGTDEIWLLSTPNDASLLATIPLNPSLPELVPFRTAVADAAGWWIGSRTGVFLATADGGLHLAAATPAIVVGGCT